MHRYQAGNASVPFVAQPQHLARIVSDILPSTPVRCSHVLTRSKSESVFGHMKRSFSFLRFTNPEFWVTPFPGMPARDRDPLRAGLRRVDRIQAEPPCCRRHVQISPCCLLYSLVLSACHRAVRLLRTDVSGWTPRTATARKAPGC